MFVNIFPDTCDRNQNCCCFLPENIQEEVIGKLDTA